MYGSFYRFEKIPRNLLPLHIHERCITFPVSHDAKPTGQIHFHHADHSVEKAEDQGEEGGGMV